MGRNALTGQGVSRSLCAAAVLYSAWLLSYVLPTRVGTVDAYVSELTARDQPHRLLYVACDALAGLLSVGVALAAVRAERARRAPADVVGGWGALGVFGLATMLDVT